MNSTASQSSSSGCDGGSPILPKLLGVRTSPSPKWCCHRRLTITRAVSGLSRCTSHSAKPRRRQLDFASAGASGNVHSAGLAADSTPGDISEPGASGLPRCRKKDACGARSRSPMARALGSRGGRCASTAAISAFTAAWRAFASPGISATTCSSWTRLRSDPTLRVSSIWTTLSRWPSVRCSGGVFQAIWRYSGSLPTSRATIWSWYGFSISSLRACSGLSSASIRCRSAWLARTSCDGASGCSTARVEKNTDWMR